MTISEFLTARVDEIEAAAKEADRDAGWRAVGDPWGQRPRPDIGRMRREVEFYREILGQYRTAADWGPGNWPRGLLLFVAIWSDHPDYDPAWAVG